MPRTQDRRPRPARRARAAPTGAFVLVGTAASPRGGDAHATDAARRRHAHHARRLPPGRLLASVPTAADRERPAGRGPARHPRGRRRGNPAASVRREPLARVHDGVVSSIAKPTGQDRYNAALLEAVDLMAERKYNQALIALETARSVQDTEQVPHARSPRSRTFWTGRPRTSAPPRTSAAWPRTAIRRRPPAWPPAPSRSSAAATPRTSWPTSSSERPGQHARRRPGRPPQTAGRRGRSRARRRQPAHAAIAYDQALQIGDDPELHRTFDDLRAALARYDDLQRQAADLRHDPSHLNDALSAYQEAQKAWDTPSPPGIDEFSFALQNRRDRVSVADFEVRGDVGSPIAGRPSPKSCCPTSSRARPGRAEAAGQGPRRAEAGSGRRGGERPGPPAGRPPGGAPGRRQRHAAVRPDRQRPAGRRAGGLVVQTANGRRRPRGPDAACSSWRATPVTDDQKIA